MKYASVSFDLTKQYHEKLTSDPIIEICLNSIDHDIDLAIKKGLYKTNIFLYEMIAHRIKKNEDFSKEVEKLFNIIIQRIEQYGYVYKLYKDAFGPYIVISWDGIYNT